MSQAARARARRTIVGSLRLLTSRCWPTAAALVLVTCASGHPLAPRPQGTARGREVLGNPGLESGEAWWTNSGAPGRQVSNRASRTTC